MAAVHGARRAVWTRETAWMPQACPAVRHARRYMPVADDLVRRESDQREEGLRRAAKLAVCVRKMVDQGEVVLAGAHTIVFL